jgi:hypothetical protein
MSNTTTTVEGLSISNFSQQVLDLQAAGFCCTDKDSRKIIRWVGCKPSVFRSSQTVFSANDLSLCSWYQEVGTYNFITYLLDPGDIQTITMDSKYILTKAEWPTNSLESQKLIEVGIGQQAGYVGMTVPFTIGASSTSTYNYTVMKDLFHFNSESNVKTPMKLNNISPYSVSISVLFAN